MADLTVTITESVTLNGAARGSTNSLTVSGVDDIYHRIITVPAGDTTIATFHSTVGTSDASLDLAHAQYIRVTNLDASAAVVLQLNISNVADATAAENAAIRVKAGESFLLGNMDAGIASSGGTTASGDTDAATIAVGALEDLESIIVTAPSEVKVEMFVASVA
jgi:hypothetical protein